MFDQAQRSVASGNLQRLSKGGLDRIDYYRWISYPARASGDQGAGPFVLFDLRRLLTLYAALAGGRASTE
jgi:hypothetical protein